jgi:HK97 family phage portal protein
MLSGLSRIAGAMGARGSELEASTNLRFRRNSSTLDMRAPANDKAAAQLGSFRGAVYASVDKIARRVAQLPVRINTMKTRGDDAMPDKAQIYYHPALHLLGEGYGCRPHEEWSRWELDYWTAVSVDLTGEAWWLIERDDFGTPARVTPLPASQMVIVFSKETGMIAGHIFVPKNRTYEDGIFIPKMTFDDLSKGKNLITPFIVHFRNPSPEGIVDPRGWSPVKAAAYSYDINMFEMIYKRTFLEQGAQLGGILQSEVALTKKQIEEYLEQFKLRHSGVRKAGLPMILPKMLKWTTTEPTPRDIQWLETVKATDSQILMIYGISDAKLGRADIGNRGTAEAMDVTFNREVVQSRLDQKKSKLNADFIPIYPGQSDKLYLMADFDDPVPADAEALLKRERQDIDLNIVSRNELRSRRGMDPMGKFGEVVWMPINQMPVDPEASALQIEMDDHPVLIAKEQAEAAQAAADKQAETDAAVEKEKGKKTEPAAEPKKKAETSNGDQED